MATCSQIRNEAWIIILFGAAQNLESGGSKQRVGKYLLFDLPVREKISHIAVKMISF